MQYVVCHDPTPDKLIGVPKRFASIVSKFKDVGTHFVIIDIIRRNMPNKPKSCSTVAFVNYHYRAAIIAQKRGIIKKIKSQKMSRLDDLQSVKYWTSQLRGNRYRNISMPSSSNSTRTLYVYNLARFNQWLPGQSFTIRRNVKTGDRTLEERILETRLENVEQLLTMFDNSTIPGKVVIRIIRTYLNDPIHGGSSPSTMNNIFCAIMSYFAKNESPVGMKYDPKRHETQETKEDSRLTLHEWCQMLTRGRPSVMLNAVMLVKFQAGLDSSTLADRFNFEAYSQISRHFGSTDHAKWDPGRCPVPIKLVRMKTGVQFITFLDRDAITAIRNYLDWRVREYGGFDANGPLFLNKLGRPIKSTWVSVSMGKLAVAAGLQKKTSRNTYKIRAHELRDLLKTTLMDCGCAQYVADFILGHKPKDSYEKPALYPDTLRREYAKASSRINVLTNSGHALDRNDDGDDVQTLRVRLYNAEQEIERLREQLLDSLTERDRMRAFQERCKKAMIDLQK